MRCFSGKSWIRPESACSMALFLITKLLLTQTPFLFYHLIAFLSYFLYKLIFDLHRNGVSSLITAHNVALHEFHVVAKLTGARYKVRQTTRFRISVPGLLVEWCLYIYHFSSVLPYHYPFPSILLFASSIVFDDDFPVSNVGKVKNLPHFAIANS
jgi:hypothetical protein